jgi:hypothetical protein
MAPIIRIGTTAGAGANHDVKSRTAPTTASPAKKTTARGSRSETRLAILALGRSQASGVEQCFTRSRPARFASARRYRRDRADRAIAPERFGWPDRRRADALSARVRSRGADVFGSRGPGDQRTYRAVVCHFDRSVRARARVRARLLLPSANREGSATVTIAVEIPGSLADRRCRQAERATRTRRSHSHKATAPPSSRADTLPTLGRRTARESAEGPASPQRRR